jgi:putative glutamine amidotransferase
MSQPVIGLTAGSRSYEHGGETFYRIACGTEYVQSLELAGAAPFILPCRGSEEVAEALVARLDGLVLTGGADLHARHYGMTPHETTTEHDLGRDLTELRVVHAALDRGLPILAICRGLQVLNVALGGTLVQDVPSQVDRPLAHAGPGRDSFEYHDVHCRPGSLIRRLFGQEVIRVNSWHHQAVARLGGGLTVTATSSDGVIEAFELEGRPVLAVQFHPEEPHEDLPHFRELFRWIVAQASGAGWG